MSIHELEALAEMLRRQLHHEGIEHSECQEALINAQMRVAALNEELVKANLKVEAFRNEAERACGDIHAANDTLQDWVNAHAADVPAELLRLLAELDFVLNGP